ncbi:stAR-related lipid transfer protein 7, mitochondrial isoform X2 [Halyomorpha halys]|nr:stAR-related lipid transfer protein 7, mitochondrial isoform X2 [Halyomorpha halys]
MIVPFFAVTRILFQNHYRTNVRNNKLGILLRKDSIHHFHNLTFPNIFIRFQRHFDKAVPPLKKKSIWSQWKCLYQLKEILKSNPVEVAKTCVEHIEFVLAQRIRRGQQMITLYSRIWDEGSFKHFFQKMRKILYGKGKKLIISGSILAFDWDSERIPVDELERHVHEMNLCQTLRKKAAIGEVSCVGPDCSCPECNSETGVNCWEPFIQEEDLMLWKMEEKHHPNSGLYCYKVYGRYADVSADDFLEVYLDTENRTKWDQHAASLKVIDSEPKSHSDVIYWETKWPTLFCNRDYVFKRRYHRNEENKVIIIMNKSTEHPMYPPTSGKARVTEYWSYMVIKSKTAFNQPGIEFSLTYFDNPGVSLPSSISLWITVQGVPNYLTNLRREALAKHERRKTLEVVEDVSEPPKGPIYKQSSGSGPIDEKPLSDYDIFYLVGCYIEKIKASL